MVAKGVPRQPPVLFIQVHDRISVQKSSYRVASMKLELTLVKEVPSKWPGFGTQSSSLPESLIALDDPGLYQWMGITEPGSTLQEQDVVVLDEPSVKPISGSDLGSEEAARSEAPASSAAISSQSSTKAPAYPTSSKSGPKNWDNIAKDDDDDEEKSADVQHFFQKLFKDSTPEQQRAMMKSYTESNGTALSTDWGSVSKGKVETQPPTGTEAKKWGA